MKANEVIKNRFISRFRVPKSIPRQFRPTIKNAPQNAKYKRLRGFKMPAAGVEPALNDGAMPSNAKLCQVSFQNKKERSRSPAVIL